MAISSFPFEGQQVTESQYDRLFREFQNSGVAASQDSGELKVTPGTGMAVNVAPGFAVIRGHGFQSTATESLALTNGGASSRIDFVVLRLSLPDNAITLRVTSSAPLRGDGDVYEVTLATITVPPNASTSSQVTILDQREFVGNRTRVWNNLGKSNAQNVRVGQLAYNVDLQAYEFYSGSGGWKKLIDSQTTQSVTWASLTGKPSTFTPSAHTHSWNDIRDKPTLTATAHKHPGTDITSIVASSQVSYDAQGSKRVRKYSPSGSGWYAVWLDGNDNFCHNTSSIRYKENVRDALIEPSDILNLRPVIYDRKDTVEDGVVTEGQKDEFGLIAEEVEEYLPELVQYEDGQVEAVRYDLIAVAAISTLQDMDKRIKELEARVEELSGKG